MTVPGFQIVGIGEVLWDLLPAGRQLGGAPANFVCHAQALSAAARLVSRVGHDAPGREVLARFAALGIPTDTIAVDPEAPTGTVSVEVGADGQPRFTIHENVAWDRLAAGQEALAAVARADAICFGTLAQRTNPARQAIGALLAGTRPEALRIFDINLRPPFVDHDVITASLAAANVVKLNEQELPVLAELLGLGGPPARQLAALADRFSLRLVALTRGGDGSLLLANDVFVEQAAFPTTVRDAVGAGDSFTAAVTVGLLLGWPLAQISHHAGAIAAFVCSQPGATPPLPAALRQPFVDALPKAAHPSSMA